MKSKYNFNFYVGIAFIAMFVVGVIVDSCAMITCRNAGGVYNGSGQAIIAGAGICGLICVVEWSNSMRFDELEKQIGELKHD